MIPAAELTEMRATSASALPDACVISRDGAVRGALDTTTGIHATASARTTVYSGACRVRPVDGQENEAEVGSLHETFARYVITLPHSAAGIALDDRVEITSSTDADLDGRWLRVLHVAWSSNQIDRRIIARDFDEQPR